MAWRIFCIALTIAILVLGYAVYSLYSARSALDHVPNNYAFGPDSANIKVVGFLDYSCVHCRDSFPTMIEAIKKDGKAKFTPLLISAPDSTDEFAMRLTYAAALQGKYREVFDDIMRNYRVVDESQITDMALKYGMDEEKLKTDINSEKVDKQVGKSEMVFKKLGGQYTPTFFIGHTIKYVPTEAPTAEDFLRTFQEARAKAGKP
jgi:protein-disulfide isomerase